MWQNELYGSSSASEQGNEARIKALSRSAGIYLRRAIDPKQRYRLRISGEGHAFRMRLKEDGSEPAYFEAPASGAAEYTIEGTSRLELLLYSDEPSDYRLTGLLLEPCAQCQTDGRLSHIEHAALPSLAGAGWRNEVYGNAEVAQRGGEVSIDAMSLPAGLRLSRALDPQQHYRLRLGGEGDALRLLIRLDDRSRSIVAAPNAEALQFTIGDASRIEVLLYAETQAHYRLTELSLEPCPRCATTKDLVERIRREVPDLDQAEGLDKAIRLLKWSANAAIWSMDDPSGAIEAMSPEDALYDVFDRKRGGVICGGQSVFYANVLHDFGVEAFTVDFGIAGSSYDHVTVVVPYMGRHYLLDPSFASYFAEAGRPVPLEELIPINRQGGLAEIDFVDLGIENREFLAQHFPEGFCTTAPQRREAGLFCKADGRSFFTTYLRGLGNALDAPELVRDKRFLISLLGYGVSYVGPSIDPAARQEFADMLTGFAIPIRE
jgi:hypothetical protein